MFQNKRLISVIKSSSIHTFLITKNVLLKHSICSFAANSCFNNKFTNLCLNAQEKNLESTVVDFDDICLCVFWPAGAAFCIRGRAEFFQSPIICDFLPVCRYESRIVKIPKRFFYPIEHESD